MDTVELRALQRTVTELLDLKAIFLSRFEDAVISALPPDIRSLVEAAIEREAESEYKSRVLRAIRRHAFPSRVSILQDNSCHWIHEVVDDAVNAAKYEVIEIVKGTKAENRAPAHEEAA
ncbi:hypothetical protein [Methylocystis heyeri]|uniref:Uncharacterized protein n=1 Tax=Methylocystis heyeri TaxID=391905 RepID=A0A6B8KC44_9HYPH|nr:hypothetical protein [Methylocystis heyeri]QGM45984.1 hypothetical protein H2LOC_009875 [Methylocystis heyeri]